MRLILLIEDFEMSRHFVDDGRSLGGAEKRREEQALFIRSFEVSKIADKRKICVTDRASGRFRDRGAILDEVSHNMTLSRHPRRRPALDSRKTG